MQCLWVVTRINYLLKVINYPSLWLDHSKAKGFINVAIKCNRRVEKMDRKIAQAKE